MTVGIEFSTKILQFEKCSIQAQIWDTAGQERAVKMTKAFYRDCAAILLVYDVCNRKSFDNLRTIWLEQIKAEGCSDVRMMLGTAARILFNFHLLFTFFVWIVSHY